jgi:methyltransferase (TIGR00027 family)
MRVAMRRAAHQLFDNPRVLEDPLAIPIIGTEAAAQLSDEWPRHGKRIGRSIRAFMVARSRYAEDQLALAVSRGIQQYVILGAGLDTFAYRNPHAGKSLRVFEVDYPATQEWKRQRLAGAGILIPSTVTYAPVDFERQTLAAGLAEAGFDSGAATFFSWLGVVMYLTEEATMSTLGFIATTARGGGVAFDFAVPRESLTWMGRLALDAISRRVASAGEPFRTFFEPRTLTEKLTQLGFHSVEVLDAAEINPRYFRDRGDGLCVAGSLGRLISAQI